MYPFFVGLTARIGGDLHIWQNLLVRITVDIPDVLYRKLKSQATREKRSVKELILRAIGVEGCVRPKKRSKRVILPLVRSRAPGTLDIDNSKIYKIISFP